MTWPLVLVVAGDLPPKGEDVVVVEEVVAVLPVLTSRKQNFQSQSIYQSIYMLKISKQSVLGNIKAEK